MPLQFVLLSYMLHVMQMLACVTHQMRQGTQPELYMLADDM